MARGRLSELNTMVNTVVTLVAIYLALRALRGTREVVDSITAPIAQKWFDLTSGPPVHVLGRVILPDGSSILIHDIVQEGSTVDSRGFFGWRGTTYQITGRNTAGDYTASRIIT